MKWNVPEIGDRRWRRIFLLIPRRIGSKKVWLETVWVQEEYQTISWKHPYTGWQELSLRLERLESPVMNSQGYSESREN